MGSIVYATKHKESLIPKRIAAKFDKIAERSQGSDFNKGIRRYPYIPMCAYAFFRTVLPKVEPGMCVVDVGCGAGDKLYEFHRMRKKLKITGIEYGKDLAKHAQDICGSFATIIHDDARNQDYSQYDLIYMYRPMTSLVGQSQLQERVIKTMREGAWLFVFLQAEVNTRTLRYFPRMLCDGWRKPQGYDPKTEPAYQGSHYWKRNPRVTSTSS